MADGGAQPPPAPEPPAGDAAVETATGEALTGGPPPRIELEPGEVAELEDPNVPAEEPTLLEQLTEASIPDDFSLSEDRKKLLTATKSELPLVLKPQVVKLVNYFSGRGLKKFQRTLERGEAYRPMIERVLAEEGAPLELFHLAQAESGFRPKARSWARATGMWQFMAFRGRQYGLRQNRYVEERYDPEAATRAAARHLKDLYVEFGDWYLAMAAYNGGPARVRRAIERSGSRDFWEISRRRLIYRETRNYVPIILAMVYMGKNPELYLNEDFNPQAPLRYGTVETESEIHFNLIADLTGASHEMLRELNPALKRSATPPHSYALRLPEGTAQTFERELAKIPEDKRLAWRSHRVGESDTLASIAKSYGVKTAELASLNNLSGGEVKEGAWLTIPSSPANIRYYYSGTAGGLLEPGTGRYRIARGDTLSGIAQRFGVSIGQLKRWNGLSSSRIRAGRYLIVQPEGAESSGGKLAGGRTYIVRKGDTLGAIAGRHGTSVARLKAWNGMRGTRIYPGQKLIVGPKASSSGSTRASSGKVRKPSPGGPRYRIRRGDTLGVLARRFGVSVKELQAWNNLRGTRITAGDSLIVRPAGGGAASKSASSTASAAVKDASPSVDGRRYTIRRGDNLQEIAQRFGVTVADLKAWNGLRGTRIIAGDSLIVRPGKEDEAGTGTQAERSSTQTAKARQPFKYRIRSGDNLASIAARHGVSVAEIKRWNSLRGDFIRAGQSLTLYGAAADSSPAGASESSGRQMAAASEAQGGEITYRIRRGDNLGAIARRYGVSVSELKAWNGLRSNLITAGETLIIRGAGGVSEGMQYEVRRGDTLGGIARRFGVTVRELMQWNGLSSSRIYPGAILRILVPPSQS